MSSETEREAVFKAAMKVRDWLGTGCVGEPPRTAAALLWTVVAEMTGPTADAHPAEPPRTVTGDEPISLDNDPRRQELFGAAITGAMAFGFQGVNPPPAGHWLTPHWETGRAQAEAQDAAVAQALKGRGAEPGALTDERIAEVMLRSFPHTKTTKAYRQFARDIESAVLAASQP